MNYFQRIVESSNLCWEWDYEEEYFKTGDYRNPFVLQTGGFIPGIILRISQQILLQLPHEGDSPWDADEAAELFDKAIDLYYIKWSYEDHDDD